MSTKINLMALGVIAAALLCIAPSAHAEGATTQESTVANVTVAKLTTIIKAVMRVTVTVQPGDTLSGIAKANNTSVERLFNANVQISNPDVLTIGQVIVIPDASEELVDRYSGLEQAPEPAAQPVAQPATSSPAPVAAAPSPAATPRAVSSAGNTYSYGWCTWYVKSRIPSLPNSLGNAYQWLGRAQALGYATGSAPAVGAVGVSGGHVVYVESVSGGNVSISEMAYAGGIGVVHYRTVPASSFYYIYV